MLLSTGEQVFDGLLLHIRQYLKGHSTMEHPPEPSDSSFEEELLLAPAFTTIGLSIPSISWLNQQLESDGDRPGVRGEKQDSQREQSQDTGDALNQTSPRSEVLLSLDRAGQRRSEEYTDLSREIEGLLALVTPSRSLRQPKKRKRLKP
ncbi:hypothetical protein BJY00DRAFT_325035 [Aspergillus carlsbadensis]|nr:hypothetical protein BJY00DRAFT_325035 [Aspergillus carlsbadensis]